MPEELSILIASDDQHTRVFAEIYFDDKFVALVNREKGSGNEEIEFPGIDLVEDLVLRKVPLKFLQEAVQRSIERLDGADSPNRSV